MMRFVKLGAILIALQFFVYQTSDAQTFSVEDTSTDTIPSVGFLGDEILSPGLPTPGVVFGTAGPTMMGGPPVEVDGFTYGQHFPINPQQLGPLTVEFSVDAFSIGAPMTGVDAEVTAGGLGEQNYDVYRTVLPPFAAGGTNVQSHDGNGLGPGGVVAPLGMFEPQGPYVHPFGPGVDGYDSRLTPGPDIYWSWDPVLAVPPTGVSFSGSDVIFSPAAPAFTAGPSSIYAPAFALGLDMSLLGPDNLDALEVFDVFGTVGVFDPGDVILFSLDPTSASLIDPLSPFFMASTADIFFATTGGIGLAIPFGDLGLAYEDNVTAFSVVPEPGSMMICLIALGLAVAKRRRRI